MASMEGNVEVDIESGSTPLEPGNCSECDAILTRTSNGFAKFDGLRVQGSEESNGFAPKSGEITCKVVHVVTETNSEMECRDHLNCVEKGYSKEKRWGPYSNKHSKPPRPPKGPLLNATDMVLVSKISELAAKKRERIERTRALKKMKGAKGSSSGGSIVAVVITVFFLIVIIFQGVCSRSDIQFRFRGSPEPSTVNKGLISLQFYSKPPANEISRPINHYPNSVEPASGSGPRVEEGRDVQEGIFWS